MSAPGVLQARGSLVRPMRTGPSLASRARLLALFVLAAMLVCAPQREDAPMLDRQAAIRLPAPHPAGIVSVEQALGVRRSLREFRAAPLTLGQASQLLWAAQGQTSEDGRRTAPSAGALYPLAVFLVAGHVEGLAPGVYRYRPDGHLLEPVIEGDHRRALSEAALGQGCVRTAPAALLVAAVPERTARKCGRRADRYVHIEVGAALQNVALQAVALGLGTVVVGAFDDAAARGSRGCCPSSGRSRSCPSATSERASTVTHDGGGIVIARDRGMAGVQPGNSDVRVMSSRRLEPAAARREPLRLRTALTHVLDDGLRALVARVFGNAALAFVWADGSALSTPRERAVASLVFRDRLTLLRVLADPDTAFGESYAEGAVDVRGDLVAALEAAYRAVDGRSAAPWTLALPGAHSRASSRHNVHRHYDLGNDFYRLWLDEQLVYTCAYFPSPDCDLDAAQVAKLDLVCRKLRLRPGERVVEAGCGWGALALHMARHYGVSVRAYNVSREQLQHARQRAWREGLADRVEFIDDDYRNALGPADVFVSVGMLEHVGLENFGALGAVMDRCLPPGRGRGLLHFIGRDRPRPLSAWIRRRIFPGAYAPTLSEVLSRVVEPGGLSVLHVENLRLHYARTLALWRERYEAAFDTVETRFGPEFARAWRLYLAGSEAAFRTGSLQLFQVTFARTGAEDVPWTRAAPPR